MYHLYIIYSERIDKYYIGFSSALAGRIRKHNNYSKGFSCHGRPWRLVYSEAYETKREAMSREAELKKWKSRVLLERLIKTGRCGIISGEAGSEHPD